MKLERYTLPAVLVVSAGAAFLNGAFSREQAGEEESQNSRSWDAIVLRDQAQTSDVTGWLAIGAAGAIAIKRRFK